MPIKRVRPYTSNPKKSKQYDSVVLDWEPINIHGFLQKTMNIKRDDYWISTVRIFNEGEATGVKHTVMFKYRKDAKRFSYVADPSRM